MNFKWVTNDRGYGPPVEQVKVGKWTVGSVSWDISSRNSDESEQYHASVLLPGLKVQQGDYPTIEEAKAKIEMAILYWFTEADCYAEETGGGTE